MRFFLPLLLLSACSDAAPDMPANAAAPVKAEAKPDAAPEVPLADRPAPQPLASGKPLAGEWDPDIMTVELAGDTLTVYDAKHAWPMRLEQSDYEFARQGMASFGTPVASKSIAECPSGQLDYLTYVNGLQLAFQNGKLVGYWVKDKAPGVATPSGITVGSPRTALGNAPVDHASFGNLVTIDGTTAVLDDKEEKVTDLYAGLACIFD